SLFSYSTALPTFYFSFFFCCVIGDGIIDRHVRAGATVSWGVPYWQSFSFTFLLSTWCILTNFSFRSFFSVVSSGSTLCVGLSLLFAHTYSPYLKYTRGYSCVFVCSLLFDVILLFVCPPSEI
ncbi:unnamed protein product, partial [Pylaiella littoralis]